MSLVLHPQNSFTVVRQIANHTDASTYYVRAVIRNAYTDDIIETLNLTDRGSQRFSKNWQVPADPSGQGFYISIVTSVYSDSGYTTKSENYGDEENTYLVQDRLATMRGGGGGVDAYTIRRIIKEELAQLPQPEPVKFPKIPDPIDRADEVIAAIKAIPQVKIPKPKDVDLSPVLEAIAAIPQADLAPVIAKIDEHQATEDQKHTELLAIVEKVPGQIEDAVRGIEFNVEPQTARAQPKKENAVPFDPKSLAL